MRYTTLALAALLSLSTSNLFAQEEHGHSDVEFVYAGGQIDVEFGDEGSVFEAEFETSGPEEQITDDPGFEGDVVPGDIIDYIILGPLVYHDGTDFAPVPSEATIDILDNPGGGMSVSASTSGPVSGTGFIGQADGSGEAHTHVEFTLSPSTLDAPEYGAYGILMELTTDASGIANSEPFYIVFNFGLDEEIYEGAVEAFAETVPEPTAGLLLALGASCFAAARRR